MTTAGWPWRRAVATATVALALGLVAGCGSDEQATPESPTCASLRELARVGVEANEVAPDDDWTEVRAALRTSIDASDAIYRELVASGTPAVREAAADLLAFDEAIVASGALDADSLDAFATTVASLPGSAESGAGSTVLKEYGRETCGFAPDGDAGSSLPE